MGAQRVAVPAERRGDLGLDVVVVADRAEQGGAVLVEQRRRRQQVLGAARQVRAAAFEDVAAGVADAWSMLPCCSLSVRAVVTAFCRPSNRSGPASAYTSARSASSWLSCRICGICGLSSERIWLPSTRDSPNRSPSPSSAWAVAVSVWFSLIGSTCSASDTTVSNKVLNSVVTLVTSMTSAEVMRCAAGSGGDENDTYLLPNTVVALMSATTFCGIRWRYFGSTSRVIFAFGSPPTLTSSTLPTRPISTPL